MGGRTSRAEPKEAQAPPAQTEDTPHTEPTPPLVVAKHSRTLSAWLERVAAQRRSGVPFRQPLDTDAVSYFELNFDIVHIVLSFLHPKDLTRVACVSKYFQSLADDNTYWHAFFALKTKPCRVPREHLGNWKKLYQEATEASSLQELLGTQTTGATITVPPGVYPPMTIGAALTGAPAADQLLQLVGVPRVGEPVVFESTTFGGLISVFGAASLHNITVRFRCVRDPKDRTASCAIYVRGSLVLENCDVSAGATGVYGVYAAERSTVVVRNCRIHDIQGPAVVSWHFTKTTIEGCHFTATDGIEVTEDCELTVRDTQVHKLRNNGIQLRARSTGRIERCKVWEGGGQGVHSDAKDITVTDCDIWQFPFSGVRSNGSAGTITVTDCRITECATGVLVDAGTVATVSSSCIRKCTTAIEIGDGGVVTATTCTLIGNQCGVAVSGPGAEVKLRECIIRKSEVGVRVAVEAKADIAGCDIRESKRYGVHVTSFEGEGTADLEGTYAANNDIALSGERNVFIDQLPKVEEVKADGESLSREVRVALQRGVCTFQLTGTHYRSQKAWHCISCKLVDSRGMCDVCRLTCHADHEVVYDGVSQFFCDCGSEGFCEVYARNKRALTSSRLGP